jgi:hypothetical protein
LHLHASFSEGANYSQALHALQGLFSCPVKTVLAPHLLIQTHALSTDESNWAWQQHWG